MAIVHGAPAARGNSRPRRTLGGSLQQLIRARAKVALSVCGALVLASPTAALTFGGNATAVAGGGPTGYEVITGPESTTGPVTATGTCSSASSQSWVSASSGALALQNWCGGSPMIGCVSNSYASGNASYSDEFVVQSPTLPPGTRVDVSLCVRAALRHGIQFGCSGSVFEGVTSTASADLFIREGNGTPVVAEGRYSERWNCYDGHDLTQTGLFSAGGGEVTLTVTQVPVGGTMTVSGSLSSATGQQSFSAHDEGRIEMAVVFGYSSASDVRLVSTTTGQELSTAGNCSAANLDLWLPPPSSTVSVEAPETPARSSLLPPAPNPVRTATTLAFALPSAGPVELSVCDVAGARVARLATGWREAGTHRVVWNGRDEVGLNVRPGVYWVRLVSAEGSASRSVVVVR